MNYLDFWPGQDKIDYSNFCSLASNDDKIFNSFKINPLYTPILEHVSFELALKYLYLIKDKSKIKIAHDINDNFGSPNLIEIEGYKISPTQLRYLKVIEDLEKLKFKFKSVVEIGGGWGGQARLICKFFDIEKYTIIDLPEVSKLQKKCCADILQIDCKSCDNIDIMSPDLIISNYAVSELNSFYQLKYINLIISNANNGYISYNPGQGKEFSIVEFINLIQKNCMLLEDIPMNELYPNNKIIVW